MSVRRFVVRPRTKNAMDFGLATTKGKLKFRGKTQKIISDETLAREIDTEYGVGRGGKREAYVYEDERLAWHEMHGKETDGLDHDRGGHRYFFGAGSTTYQENYERIFRRKENGKSQTRKRGALQTTGIQTEG